MRFERLSTCSILVIRFDSIFIVTIVFFAGYLYLLELCDIYNIIAAPDCPSYSANAIHIGQANLGNLSSNEEIQPMFTMGLQVGQFRSQ